MRILHLQFLFLITFTLCYNLSCSIIDGVTDREFHPVAGSCKIRLHPDITLRSGRNILSPLRNVSLLHGLGKPDVAIDSAARIPSAVRLVTIIHLHGNHIITLPINIRCKVVLESTVAVRTGSELMAVDVYGRVHVNSIEGNGKAVVLLMRIQGEMLPVPSYSARQSASAGSRRIAWREIALYRPVMRQIQASPMGVSIIRFPHSCRISQSEKPALIKRQMFAGTHRKSEKPAHQGNAKYCFLIHSFLSI